MAQLDIAQKIKLVKEARLFIRAIKCPTDEYLEEQPSKFDKHVDVEKIYINGIINYLLGEITYLSKEVLLMSGEGKVVNKELWKRLKDIRRLIKSQKKI